MKVQPGKTARQYVGDINREVLRKDRNYGNVTRFRVEGEWAKAAKEAGLSDKLIHETLRLLKS